MALALAREDFYEVAAGDLTILTELVRVLAKRLRELAADAPPEEARVEGEGLDKTESMSEAEAGAGGQIAAEGERTTTAGAALSAAVAGKPLEETPVSRSTPSEVTSKAAPLEPVIAPESIAPEEPTEETQPTPAPPPDSK